MSTTGPLVSPPLLDPAPDWDRPGDPRNYREYLELWHGCTSWDLSKINSDPTVLINPRAGQTDADFGQGFYTTSVKRQARYWAWRRYYEILPGASGPPAIPLQPIVLRFRMPLVALAPLESLHFVLGHFDDERFWSLVQYCRQSPLG